MSNSKRREIKGAEVRQLADKCISKLELMDQQGFGVCWESDAATLNKVAEILEIPYRISNKCDTRIGPRLVNYRQPEGRQLCVFASSGRTCQ